MGSIDYTEPTYKSWFDRNYPEYTIEEAVEYTPLTDNQIPNPITKELVPEAKAISISENTKTNFDDGQMAQIVLAVSALAILFGATYGIKRKAEDSRQISKQKNN